MAEPNPAGYLRHIAHVLGQSATTFAPMTDEEEAAYNPAADSPFHVIDTITLGEPSGPSPILLLPAELRAAIDVPSAYRALADVAEALGNQAWRDGHIRTAVREWLKAAGYRNHRWSRF